ESQIAGSEDLRLIIEEVNLPVLQRDLPGTRYQVGGIIDPLSFSVDDSDGNGSVTISGQVAKRINGRMFRRRCKVAGLVGRSECIAGECKFGQDVEVGLLGRADRIGDKSEIAFDIFVQWGKLDAGQSHDQNPTDTAK